MMSNEFNYPGSLSVGMTNSMRHWQDSLAAKALREPAVKRQLEWLRSDAGKREMEMVKRIRSPFWKTSYGNYGLPSSRIKQLSYLNNPVSSKTNELVSLIQQVPDNKLSTLLPKKIPKSLNVTTDQISKEDIGTEVENNSAPNKNAVSNEAAQDNKTDAQLNQSYENIMQVNDSSPWSISSLRNDMPNEIRSYLISNFIGFIVWVTWTYGPNLAEQTASVFSKWIAYLIQQG